MLAYDFESIKPINEPKLTRKLSESILIEISKRVNELDLKNRNEIPDLNDRWLSFKPILLNILNTEPQIRKINKRKQDPLPSYDDELKTLCEIMNEAHSKYFLSNAIKDQ